MWCAGKDVKPIPKLASENEHKTYRVTESLVLTSLDTKFNILSSFPSYRIISFTAKQIKSLRYYDIVRS